ncbi:MAG: hypothetical protein AAFZ80_05245 [Cyanobacteria bacterium P01_A01_bin.105]
MSDTTAYVAGCATTGVAVLVLLVAKVGIGSNEQAIVPDLEPIEPVPTVPVPAVPSPEPEWGDELRQELDRQRDLVSKLESQLAQQEVAARNLENQLRQQQEESRAVVSQLGEYQRSVDTLSVRNDQLVQTRRDEGLQTTLLWVGGGVALVMVLGGGAVMLCMVFMATQSNRRPERPMSVVYPLQMPTPPSYRYYEQEFLPPAPRPRRVDHAPQYDYDV